MTVRHARRRLVLADDGIIDPIAVELAARGARPVALTRAERHPAATILARGSTDTDAREPRKLEAGG